MNNPSAWKSFLHVLLIFLSRLGKCSSHPISFALNDWAVQAYFLEPLVMICRASIPGEKTLYIAWSLLMACGVFISRMSL